MVCRVFFPGVGHLGEQESWGRRSAGRAGAGADEGFCCTVWCAAEGPPRRSKENTRSPPGRGVSGLTDTASETPLVRWQLDRAEFAVHFCIQCKF